MLGHLTDTVTIKAHGGMDGLGTAQADTTTDEAAMVEPSSRLVRNQQGDEVMSKAKVTLGPSSVVALGDVITMPDGTTGPVLQIDSPKVLTTTHQKVAWIG